MNPVPIINLIIGIVETAAVAVKPLLAGNPDAKAANDLAEALAKIAGAAAQAYQQTTGQPINLDLLQPIDPVA